MVLAGDPAAAGFDCAGSMCRQLRRPIGLLPRSRRGIAGRNSHLPRHCSLRNAGPGRHRPRAPAGTEQHLVGVVQVPGLEYQRRSQQRWRPEPWRRARLQRDRREQMAGAEGGRIRHRRRRDHRDRSRRRLHRVGGHHVRAHAAGAGDLAHRQGQHPLEAHWRCLRRRQLRRDGHLRRKLADLRPHHRRPVFHPGRAGHLSYSRAVCRRRRVVLCPGQTPA